MRCATLLVCLLSACSFGDDLDTIVPASSTCGDGVVDTGETCDDGNTAAGDGCSATCKVEVAPVSECGDGTVDAGEQCDDGNHANGDGCSASCRTEAPTDVCGDGVVAASEQCDDGNTVAGDGCSACLSEIVLFSEYVEGASNNKAIEFKSAGGAPFDFAGCELHLYFNGAAEPAVTADLSAFGVLAPESVIVLCHASASDELLDRCDFISTTAVNFNGDDALEITCDGVTQDVLGQIGVDPGVEWLVGEHSTLDSTLRRSCTVEHGDGNGTDEFDGTGWVGFDVGDFSDLGLPTCVD